MGMIFSTLQDHDPIWFPEHDYDIGESDRYILERAVDRMVRWGPQRRKEYLRWEPKVAIGGTCCGIIPFGHRADWRAITDWLDEEKFAYYAWTPFSNAHRAYFAFADENTAIAFKLRF